MPAAATANAAGANAPAAAAGLPIGLRITLPRLRPEVAARLAAARPPTEGGAREYCRPVPFNGQTGYVIAPGAVLSIAFEILDSPGRLTLLTELGLVRRIYLRDTPPPEAFDESDAGTSIARFEGRTLVVHTTGLNPQASAVAGLRDTALGRGAAVQERFTLTGADELEIVTTVTAPELYAAPVTTTNRFRREAGRELVVMSLCVDGDRSWDASTGSERFDATPPPDLPPPPSG